jgi:PAP2 superfamily
MNAFRRSIAVMLVAALVWCATPVAAQTDSAAAKSMLHGWYGVVLKLVRHTPTYSPPVASRSFAYLGVTAFEALASGNDGLDSLAGKLNGLHPVPGRAAGRTYDDAVVVQAALAHAVRSFFGNTGPTGQRVMVAAEKKFRAQAAAGLEPAVVARSEAYGRAVAEHILAWSQGDGGATIENMGFPHAYELSEGDAHWVPTSLIAQQQKPLLPKWGGNRTFAMPHGAACPLPSPPPYSEEKSSEFYRQALEVYETAAKLSSEQQVIARFWSDDPMLSPTPPGHWIAIALESLSGEDAGAERIADVLARLGIAMADAFVGCWNSKYQFDLLRPVTYIRRVIDPKWEPLLITPPFPEYPSGHSTQSGAAATVLTGMFGANFAFADSTHERDGMPARNFPSFWAAAEEAGISRLYGGIHFRAAVERGLDQGRCIGAHAMALRTRR